MATSEVVIGRLDERGGTGANFIVEWSVEDLVDEPIVEVLMTSTSTQQGISFLTSARVLVERPSRHRLADSRRNNPVIEPCVLPHRAPDGLLAYRPPL